MTPRERVHGDAVRHGVIVSQIVAERGVANPDQQYQETPGATRGAEAMGLVAPLVAVVDGPTDMGDAAFSSQYRLDGVA